MKLKSGVSKARVFFLVFEKFLMKISIDCSFDLIRIENLENLCGEI